MADTILIPFELPDADPIAPVLVSDLASLDIVLLGHYNVPEQTPVEVAADQFGDAAQAELEELAEPFREAGASVRTRMEFGKARQRAIEQVAFEEGCVAELDPAPTDGIERILVPLPDVPEFTLLPEFISVLSEDSTQEVTLFHVVEGDEDPEQGEQILAETRSGLIENGVDASFLDTLLVEGTSHDEEILNAAADYDAVVMYEPEPKRRDRVFGTLADRIATETGDPVIVVQRDY